MRSAFRFVLLLLLALVWSIISSCGFFSNAPEIVNAITPSGTPTPSQTPSPTPSKTPQKIKGEIELFFLDPIVDQDCTAHFPFVIEETDGLQKFDGAGILDCKISDSLCGDICVMYHGEYYMDGSIGGFLYPAQPPLYPDGYLEIYLSGPYKYTHWLADVPPDMSNPFSKEHPAIISVDDIVILTTNFMNGARFESPSLSSENPWIFTLHLD